MKRIGFIFVLLTFCAAVQAVPADVFWQLFYQPDGTVVELRLAGDEYERHYEGRDGYVYELRADGFWERIDRSESERRIARRRSASPLAVRPRRAGGVNLAPRGLVILVNYSDISFDASNSPAGMTDMLNGEDYTYEGATGSARRYFIDQSDGKYSPQFDVVGPLTLDNPRSYYGANNGSRLDVNAAQMTVDACIKADEAGVDFTLYDSDHDGTVDFVFIIFADKGEADGGPAESIWPHNWYVRSGAKKTCIVDGLYIDNYACAAEKSGRTGKRSGIGTFCHEFGHVIGLPDYYDTKSGVNYSNHLTPRYWSIMDIGSYLNESKTPPNYSTFDRYYLGWLTPVNLGTEEQRVTLTPIGQEGYKTYQITNSGQLVPARKEETVYYIECRERIGWDRYLPGHGMLIWQVKYNSSAWTKHTPNNTAYSPFYTILSATGSTTDLGTSNDSYPGNMEVTGKQLTATRTLSDITEENQQVSFVYNRTRKTVILTAVSTLSLDDQTSSSSPSYTVTGTFKDGNGESYKARIQILSSAYAGNYTSTNISLANSWLEQGGVRMTATGISGKVTISGQSLYHTDLSMIVDEFTTYRLVGDFKVSAAEPVQHTLDISCTEGGSVTLLATDYTSKTNTGTYAEGTQVQLLPAPDKGWQFSSWGGKDAAQVQSSGGIYRITMGQNDLSIDAAFVRRSCDVRSACSPADKGTVTIRLGGNTLTNGSEVPYMTQVTFEAAAKENYRFDGWSDGDITNPRTVTVTGDTLLTAMFSYVIPKPENHTITVASSAYGQVRLRSINTKDNINSGTYQEGTTVVLTPEPAAGYLFAEWIGTDASFVSTANGVYSLVIGKQDYSLDTRWEKQDYAVTVESSPNGSGSTTVTADGKEIAEGATVPYMTKVVVSATAANGWTFTRWSDNETANPREMQITDALRLTAYFTRRNYTITTTVTPDGKAAIEATVNGTVADLNAIPYETNLTLAVRPVQGWQFEQWSDGKADNPRTYIIKDNLSLTAQVSRRLFTVTGLASPANNGVVKMTADSKTVSNGTALPYETEVVYEAIPAKSYRFDGWSDGVTTNPRSVTLTDNLVLTALFSYVVPEPETHTINIGASEYGHISLRSAGKEDGINKGTYEEGTTVVLVPQPETGYKLAGWQGKDASAVTESKGVYTIVIGKQDYELEAVWKKESYPVTVTFSPDGKGDVTLTADGKTVTNGSSVEYLTTVTLQAAAATGWRFVRWNDGGTVNPRELQVKEPTALTAYFERQTYSLTLSVNPTGKATVSVASQGSTDVNTEAIPYETELTLAVTPEEGWQFEEWSDGQKKNPRVIRMTGDMTLAAEMIRRSYVVTSAVSPAGKGTVRLTADGKEQADGSQLPFGTEAVFEAVPVTGWRFAGWSDGETANPRTITVTTTVGITAVMVREQYTVQTGTLPTGKGDVSLTVNQTAMQSGEKADYESPIRMEAHPLEGWLFDGWSDGETANPRTFVLTQDTIITAQFRRRQYTLQTSASPSDKGTVIGTASGQPLDNEVLLDYETVVQLYASASTNCHFVCWSDSVTDNPRMITMTGNKTFQAVFARDDIDYLSIRDDGDSLYYDNMSAYEDAKVRLVVIERTIKANTYSTFCLPFDVKDIKGTDLCGSVLQFISATGDAEKGMTLNFTFATEIKAGVPYLLLASDTIVNPFFKDVTMRGFEGKTLKGGTVEFRAVVRPVHLMNMGRSVAAFLDNKVYYPNTQTGMYLNAFRAYFFIPGNVEAPIRRINILPSEELPREAGEAERTTD